MSISPPVLFFVLGAVAAFVKSHLRVPKAVTKLMSLYLLWAIGFTGGVKIAQSGVTQDAVIATALGIALSAVMPFAVFGILRRRIGIHNAAAAAACYGSVSAVTFIAATNYLKAVGVPFENHAAAFLAVMESPAILIGVVLGKLHMKEETQAASAASLRTAVHEALFGRSIFLLVGALLVGALTGEAGMKKVEPFFVAPFQGVLALFLLEMGVVAGRRVGDLRKVGLFLLGFGVLVPLVNGALGVLLGQWSGLSPGGAALLGVLSASASYIAAPAAIRVSLPEANPTLYLTASLAITFPFNITFGIPVCLELARLLSR